MDIRYELKAFTDGSCKGNGTRFSSIATGVRLIDVLIGGDPIEHSQAHGEGTNNQAELQAIYDAFKVAEHYCKTKRYPLKATRLTVSSDSQYALGVLTGDYRIRHHHELVNCTKMYAKLFGQVVYEKVVAHAGHLGNEGADRLASKGHPEKRKVTLFSEVKATNSDILTTLHGLVGDPEQWKNVEKTFPMKKGKSYAITLTVREL